jgi:FkbM family methyltransferase
VDVGAYIGYYSILARNIVGELGKVISFEPNPMSFKMLRKNIEINGYKNCIAENIALWDEEGFLKLFIGKCIDGSCSLFLAEEVDKKRYVMVKTMTFDKYSEINDISPDLIKIDAEGAEYKILKGMEKVMDANRPKLVIEVHPQHLEKGGISLHALFDLLKGRDYDIQLVRREGAEVIPAEELVNLCKNGRKNRYGTWINQIGK